MVAGNAPLGILVVRFEEHGARTGQAVLVTLGAGVADREWGWVPAPCGSVT